MSEAANSFLHAGGDSLESKVRHRRSLRSAAKALMRGQNYAALIRALQVCPAPVDFMSRYVRNSGRYPHIVNLRTPIGLISANTYAPDDIQTVNEIFLRGDYASPRDNKIIVDFGSNIGISAIYFLSRNPEAFCYCFEPVPQNIERFETNLAPFAGRYELAPVAVGEGEGVVRFGCEPTGRYGGIGRDTGDWIDVNCVDSNAQLARVIERHGRIDLLKVDIETMEEAVTRRIPFELASVIGDIVVEYRFSNNPLARTHEMVRMDNITRFHPIGRR